MGEGKWKEWELENRKMEGQVERKRKRGGKGRGKEGRRKKFLAWV